MRYIRKLSLVLLLTVFIAHPEITLSIRPPLIPPKLQWGWAQRFYHERGRYFEGDIMIQKWPPSDEDSLKAGSNNPRWREGIIPYSFHQSIRMPGRQAVIAAMQDIQSKTCIRFVNWRRDKDYVQITSENQGCFSYVGRAGGRQQLNLGHGCWHKTTIIHELVHAVGFWHEQSRIDRDKYINIQWDNIPKNLWKEFQKHSKLKDFGTKYDLRSVMHYSYNAFGRNKRRPTITTKNAYPLRLLGTGDEQGGLTETDALQINRMYNCTRNIIDDIDIDVNQPKKIRGKG